MNAQLSLDNQTPTAWTPSSELRSALTVGMWATLALVVLILVEAGLTLLWPPQTAAEPIAHGLAWLSMIPAFWVFTAFAKIGTEAEYPSVRNSAISLFAALILWQLVDVATMDLFGGFVQIGVWLFVLLCFVVVLVLPFALKQPAKLDEKAAAESARIAASSKSLAAGARVLANYQQAGVWYAGSLKSIQQNAFEIAYDDGTNETLTAESVVAEQLMPVDKLAIGDRVLARWWGGSEYYPGTVIGLRAGEVEVRYDDGDEEWSKLDAVKLPMVDEPPAPLAETIPSTTRSPVPVEDKKSMGATVAGIAGFIAVTGFTIIRFGVKGAMTLRRATQLPGNELLDLIVGIVILLFLILLTIYFIWFAVAKLVARSKLGGLAVVLSVVEMLGLAAVIGVVVWVGVEAISTLLSRPNMTDAQMERLMTQFGERINANLAVLASVLVLVWGALTMLLFWSLRKQAAVASSPQLDVPIVPVREA